MASDEERRLILEMIDEGKITAEEGLRLLQAVEAGDESEYPQGEAFSQLPQGVEVAPDQGTIDGVPAGTSSPGDSETVTTGSQTGLPPEARRWRRWWHVPLWGGVGIIALSGLWMVTILQRSGMNFWFLFAWLPFLLGLALIVLAWESRTSRWLYLRVHQRAGEWPERIAFGMPLPLGPASWFLRHFKDKIPGLQGTTVDELILALGESATPDNPLIIEVDEGQDGESVKIYIG
jgi:hypothetical protein